jgi:hypothetical protein
MLWESLEEQGMSLEEQSVSLPCFIRNEYATSAYPSGLFF